MSVIQIEKIDFISVTQEGNVQLTISDHLLWNDNEHLLLLQAKINSYLRFIESGEIFDSYPEARDRQIIIMTLMKYEPNRDALIFLNRCKEAILNAGFGFEWKTIKLD